MTGIRARAAALCIAAGMSLAPLPVGAQSLTDAMISAYRNSTQLQIDRAALRGTDEFVAQAVAGTRPTFGASLTTTGTFSSIAGTTTFASVLAFSASLTLWDGGSTKLGIEAANSNVKAARANLKTSEQSVLLEAVTAFMDMRRDLQFLELALNNQEVLARQVQATRDRYDVGEVRRTDVSLAEAALAGAQAGVAKAQGDLEITREKYNLAVGKYPGQLHRPPSLPRIPATLAAAKSIAIRTNPGILRAQHLVKSAELNTYRAEAAMKPALKLSGTLSRSTSSTVRDAATISLGATAPIYAGGSLTSLHRQALADKEQALFTLQLAGKQVEQAVANSWARIEIARASIVARHKEVRSKRVALQGIREEASLGASTTLDILNAEADLVRAETNLATAEHDHYVAVYSLLSAMGLMTIEHLNLGIKAYDVDANYKKVANAPGPSDRGKLLDKILTRAGKK